MPLQTCTENPSSIGAAGRIFFGIADLRIRAKSAKLLRSFGYEVDSTEPVVLILDLAGDALGSVLRALSDELAGDEFGGIRVYVSPDPNERFSVSTAVKMTSASELVVRLESEWLVAVLREGSLTSYFQPVVEMQTGNVIAHECLLRAFDRSGHAVAPTRVFATARELGLLADVDLTARLTAIRAAAVHSTDCAYFVNFDTRACTDLGTSVVPTIEAAKRHGIKPKRLVFEMTAAGDVTDIEQARRVAEAYREAGFQFALDDVQPGYRSLQLLHELRPDYVKLDMRLTRCIRLDSLRQAVAQHMLDRTHKEGVLTVVEGIESAEEWDWCRDHGADFAQGYFFAPPNEVPVFEPTNPAFRVRLN